MTGARALALGATLALLAGVGACSQGPAPDGATAGNAGNAGNGAMASSAVPARRPIEMFSWWERVGAVDPLGALIKQHQAAYPGDIIINASAGLSGLARKTLRSRMAQREPPDLFQANAGADLMQWVLVNRVDAQETKLLALDDVMPAAEMAEWRRQMPARLLEEVSFDGKLYGVPSNVHRINTIFYNRRVFDRYGLAVPTSVADFRAMAKKLKGTGVSLLAVGSKEPWTLALVAFECLLVSREGPTFYNDYLRGKLKPDDPRLLATLDAMLELGTYFNPDHAQRNWLQAIDLVVRGQAAMTPMGDWASMFFNTQGMKNGQDYAEIAFPGSEGTFVFTSDAFALPIEARNEAGALRLLHTLGSAEAQRAIAGAKGVLSPRADVHPPAGSQPIQQQKHVLWQKGALVLALSGIAPPRFSEDVAVALAEMLSRRDPEPVLHTLRSRYPLLK